MKEKLIDNECIVVNVLTKIIDAWYLLEIYNALLSLFSLALAIFLLNIFYPVDKLKFWESNYLI